MVVSIVSCRKMDCMVRKMVNGFDQISHTVYRHIYLNVKYDGTGFGSDILAP